MRTPLVTLDASQLLFFEKSEIGKTPAKEAGLASRRPITLKAMVGKPPPAVGRRVRTF